ncbi:DUF2189 domain-containing protein [Poseidonocella sp. HB161398]|uniref:DUF2189 domain-containing protein n=1 Tax=Poseidonocella sp. HB161398 TaxID=2320855 RepID=UPI001F10A707|nr:DUF2189 domain-containing protein [Poseidonocella sp. HB161398]
MTHVEMQGGRLPQGAPELHPVTWPVVRQCLERGWDDFCRAPAFGLFFGLVYALGGLAMFAITEITGQSYWLILAAFGFPLIGPFAAVGLYEVSRRLEQGEPLDWPGVLGVLRREAGRQIPSLAVLVMGIFIIWIFLAHMLFALFLGKMTMVNVFTSWDIFFSANGMMLIAMELAVGAALAALLFSVTVFGMPMLLDREVDYVTAILTSLEAVKQNPRTMAAWAAIVAGALLLAMLPFFLGLLVVLPVLGHATWHLYRAAVG